MQVSDCVGEFLCIGDQLRLIDVDKIRMRDLAQYEMKRHELETYVAEMTNEILEQDKGCGRLKYARQLDKDYLEKREQLLKKYGDLALRH